MEATKVDMFIVMNSRFLESHQVGAVRDRLNQLDETKWSSVQTVQFKDPNTSLIVSLIAGQFGIDRFLIGDTGLGIGKLLTCGGFGIWTIVDWFVIQDATREKNMMKIQQVMSF